MTEPVSRLISLAACSTLDAGPLGTIEAAHRAGYSSVGLRVGPELLTPRMVASLRDALSDADVRLWDFEIVRLNGNGVALFKPLLAAAAALGAEYVLTVSDDRDLERVRMELGMLAEMGAREGVKLAFEFVPFIGVRTLEEAAALLADCAAPNAFLMVDALHLARSGGVPEDLLPHLDRIAYLQICDAPATAPGWGALELEAKHQRLAPGEGGLPLVELLDVVPEVPVVVEVLSDDYERRFPPAERAAMLRARTESLLALRA